MPSPGAVCVTTASLSFDLYRCPLARKVRHQGRHKPLRAVKKQQLQRQLQRRLPLRLRLRLLRLLLRLRLLRLRLLPLQNNSVPPQERSQQRVDS
jgi:hypothetical protein